MCVCLTGLQKEGWYIFRHLMTELLVLAVGFFTFVPAIQVDYDHSITAFALWICVFEE